MTRGEAIQWLEWCRDNYFLNAPIKWDVAQASRMAIQALSAEPCEDAISRQAVIENQKLIYKEYCKTDHEKALMEELARINQDLPPATPKQKMGRWIIKDGKEQGYDIAGVKTWYIQIMCDKCGFIKTAIEGHTGQYKYCPNCGQPKMVESQAEKGNE